MRRSSDRRLPVAMRSCSIIRDGCCCLHLGAAWGFRVDQSYVDRIETYALKRQAKYIQPFIDRGFIRADGTEDQGLVKRLCALAYGASEPCAHCNGTGKIPSPSQRPIRCTECKGWCLPTAKDGPKCRDWRKANPNGCARCANTGSIQHPNPKMIGCVIKGAKGSEDEESEDDVKTCDGSGLVLTDDVPRTEKGGVGIGRDPLIESGDDLLMSYGYFQEDQKVLDVYVPYFRRARVPVNGHLPECETLIENKKSPKCRCPGPYFDVPLTLSPKVPLATGRVSYSGAIMLLPRRPGFVDREFSNEDYIPSLRECIVGRGPQYRKVEVPDDYILKAGELRC